MHINFNMNKKAVFGVYIILDILLVGMGMGVPFFCILLGFPTGWYLANRLMLSKKDLDNILGLILKYAFLTSAFTLILMIVIWGPMITMLWNPDANFANIGIPFILYDPKMSFIGWIILMIVISPFLQLLTTTFTSNVTLWRLLNNRRDEKLIFKINNSI